MILYEEDVTGKLTPCTDEFKNRRALVRDMKAHPEKYADPFDAPFGGRETLHYRLLPDSPLISVKMKTYPEIIIR